MTSFVSLRPDLPDELHRWVGRCKSCRTPVSAMLPHQAHKVTDYFGDGKVSRIVYRPTLKTHRLAGVPCPSCSQEVRLQPVKGRYSEERVCDARCTGATGPNCECQCGGANHGAAHAA